MKCETIPDLENFLKIQEQALGESSPEVATTTIKLGDLYFAASNLDAAERLYKKALQIRRDLTGVHRNDHEEAEERLRRVQAARGTKVTLTPPTSGAPVDLKSPERFPNGKNGGAQTSVSSNNSSAPYSAQASAPVNQGTTGGGTISSDRLPSLSVPSSNAQRQASTNPNLIQDAIKETEVEVDILRQMSGSDHPSVADMLTRLADLYCRMKQYSKMEPLLVEALRIREGSCGPEHVSVSTELKNLARLYVVQERYALAEPLFKRALAIREQAWGRNHPRIADIEEHYAVLLRKTNRISLAEQIEEHAATVRKEWNSSSSLHKQSAVFN
jgi:tetratricopeptide (TPR) repeat protein